VLGVIVVLALIAGGTATWLISGDERPSQSSPGDDPTPLPTTGGEQEDASIQRGDAISKLLEARSRAILAKDKQAFLAQIDPQSTRFRTRQATVFDRIAKVPLATWEYDYEGEGPTLSRRRAAVLPEGAFLARVVLRYTFDGSDSPVESQQFLTVVPRDESWLIAGDRDNEQELTSGRDVWELGPVNVARGRTSLVIGEASREVLRSYARDADQGVRDVAQVWKGTWSRRAVVIVPRTQADMALVVGTSADGLDQIAAVTTGYSAAGPTHGDRVVINPAAWRQLSPLGRRVVMSHEVTHLATRAVTYDSVPIWLSEGFADYVAYEAVDLPVATVAQDLLRQVRAGKGPRELADDTDFDAAKGDLAPAYESSWLAARMIAERYGEKKLVRLYVELADPEGGAAAEDFTSVLGISEQRLVRDWRAYMSSLADG